MTYAGAFNDICGWT